MTEPPQSPAGAAIPVAPLAKELGERFDAAGHQLYLVGGSVRDLVLGRQPFDWDLATSARPEQLLETFPGAVYENRFGTVAVRRETDVFEITTFRTEHEYADFRRPHRVEFGDVGVNTISWAKSDDHSKALARSASVVATSWRSSG